MPDEGLDTITQEVANRMAAKMAAINQQGITVWLYAVFPSRVPSQYTPRKADYDFCHDPGATHMNAMVAGEPFVTPCLAYTAA